MKPETDESADVRWLLLLHQLPAKPAYFRVKIWRRLQALGAIAIKNAVNVLPANEQSHEDFEWLLQEIVAGGGEAMLVEARLLEGFTDVDVRALFNAARDEDYNALAEDVRGFAEELANAEPGRQHSSEHARAVRLRKRLDDIATIDFFGASGNEAAEGLLADLEARLMQMTAEDDMSPTETADARPSLQGLRGRRWVTRAGVHVDRIASAWLIRRVIDSDASFKFVPAKGYRPQADELRFDMYQAEFTHEGDQCTFEVLLRLSARQDTAYQAIAEIVHDIDLKDHKFNRPEAEGIKTLIAGICLASSDDDHRLQRGAAVFDDLYRYFQKNRD